MKQATYTRCVKPLGAVMARAHVAVHRATGGRAGRRWRGGEVGLLSTTGRRTGLRRTTPLVCLRDDTGFVVVASNGGSDRTPDWLLNLLYSPHGELELGGRTHMVVAERVPVDASVPMLERFSQTFPHFQRYRARTSRVIPVVALRPVSAEVTR